MSRAYDRETDVRDASDKPLIVGFIVSLLVHLLVLMLVPAWTPNLGMDVYSLDEGGIIQLEALRPSTGVGEELSTSGLPSGRPGMAESPDKPAGEGLSQEKSQAHAVQVQEKPSGPKAEPEAEPEDELKETVQMAEIKPQPEHVKVQDSARPAAKPVEEKPVEVKPTEAKQVAPKSESKPAAAPSPEPKAYGTDKSGVSGVLTSQAGTVAVKTQPQSGLSSTGAPELPAAKPSSEAAKEASIAAASDGAEEEGAPAAAPKVSGVSGAGPSSGTGAGAVGASGTGGVGSSPVAGDAPQQGVSGMSMVLSAHKPAYPKNAQNARAKGQVRVLIRVSPDGNPVSVTVVESSGDTGFGFDMYVVKTIEKGWRFKTASSEYELELTFRFDLDAKEPVKIEGGDVRFITQR